MWSVFLGQRTGIYNEGILLVVASYVTSHTLNAVALFQPVIFISINIVALTLCRCNQYQTRPMWTLFFQPSIGPDNRQALLAYSRYFFLLHPESSPVIDSKLGHSFSQRAGVDAEQVSGAVRPVNAAVRRPEDLLNVAGHDRIQIE